VHATAVTASQSMPAGQLSVHTMASCYNCCVHSFRVHSTFRTCLPAKCTFCRLNNSIKGCTLNIQTDLLCTRWANKSTGIGEPLLQYSWASAARVLSPSCITLSIVMCAVPRVWQIIREIEPLPAAGGPITMIRATATAYF